MLYKYLTCCDASILCEKGRYTTFKGMNYQKIFKAKKIFINYLN